MAAKEKSLGTVAEVVDKESQVAVAERFHHRRLDLFPRQGIKAGRSRGERLAGQLVADADVHAGSGLALVIVVSAASTSRRC
jgi:hypothetical protein